MDGNMYSPQLNFIYSTFHTNMQAKVLHIAKPKQGKARKETTQTPKNKQQKKIMQE